MSSMVKPDALNFSEATIQFALGDPRELVMLCLRAVLDPQVLDEDLVTLMLSKTVLDACDTVRLEDPVIVEVLFFACKKHPTLAVVTRARAYLKARQSERIDREAVLAMERRKA
jgi:hypothetical protein